MALRDPVWLACGPYVYFAIPFREFGVKALEAAKPKMHEGLILSDLQKKLPGEIRQATITAGENAAIPVVNAKAPANIAVPVRRAIRNAIA